MRSLPAQVKPASKPNGEMNLKQVASAQPAEIKYGSGKILTGNDAELMLSRAGLARERIASHGAQFIRLKHSKGYIYFISNLGAQQIKERIRFSTPAKSAIIYDPLTGDTGMASVKSAGPRGADIFIQLLPGQSMILKTFADEALKGKPWPYYEPFGGAFSIKTNWKVEFIEGGPELPETTQTAGLQSWTEFAGKKGKYFAGTARYTADFMLPPVASEEWLMDLGRVAESARVRLNGHDAGALWSLPFVARVGAFLKPGEVNRIEIEVTNLMANRIILMDKKMSPWKIFHDANIVDIHYKTFDASNWEPMESGLLGPVWFIPVFNPIAAEKQ